jgi:hypothetical protein
MKLSRSVDKVLQEADSDLAILVTRTRQLRALTDKLRSLLDPALAKHCYLGGIDGEKLTILVDSAAWASKFRFYSQSLLPALNELHPAFARIKTFQIKVLNQTHQQEPVPYQRPEMNLANARGLKTLADNVDDTQLSEALTRLAGRASEKKSGQ